MHKRLTGVNYWGIDPLHGSSYFPYSSKEFPQIATHPDNTRAAEDTVFQEGKEKNPAAKHNDPNCIIYDLTREVAAESTLHIENHNHKKELNHDFDLNKTPLPKSKRRKHRPKVIKESKPRRTSKKVTAESVQSKGNPTDKRKQRRKGLKTSFTPQTEVTEKMTKPWISESANTTCRRSLNFDTREQARENAGYRKTRNFDKDTRVVIEEKQSYLYQKYNFLRTNPNLNYNSCSRAQLSPNDGKFFSREYGVQAVGSKRKQPSIEQDNSSSINMIGAEYYTEQAYCQDYVIQFQNVQKKRRSEKGRTSSTSCKSSVTATKDVEPATYLQDARLHSHVSSPNCWNSVSEYSAAGLPVMITAIESDIHDKLQSLEYNLSLGQKRPTKRRSRVSTRIHAHPAHNAKQKCSSNRQTFMDAKRPQTCIDALVADMGATLTKKKRTRKRSTPVNSTFSCTHEKQHNTSGIAPEDIWKKIHTVEALTEQFRCLTINRETQEPDRTIIPHKKPSDAKIMQITRAKVDIDKETDRVCTLLLADINRPGIDGSETDKAKWWEEERKVFHGRADSFIARMHLVQGDRRFSMWKGSVVDSVVGVFLTQNVSDHLSSSAFMSLAARFPLRSNSDHKTCYKESTSFTVNEPQECVVEPEENENLKKKIFDQSGCELNSMIKDESNSNMFESAQRHKSELSRVESGAISVVTEEGKENLCHGSVRKELNNVFSPQCSPITSQISGDHLIDQNSGSVRKELNDVFSPQCSPITSQISGDHSIDQNPEKLGSFADSNSEIEDLSSAAQYNIYHNRTSFRELLEMASSTMMHKVNSQRSKSPENFRYAYDHSIDWNHANLVENLGKSDVTRVSVDVPITNEYTSEIIPNSETLAVNCYKPLQIQVPSNGSSKDKGKNDKISSFPTASYPQAAIVHSQGQTQDPMQKERKLDFGDPNNEMGNKKEKIHSTPIRSRTKKHGEEKTQAQAGKRERSENNMDTVDWDAVRRADVNEISNIIKERGMNNMLADRIQSFLNRMVDKHKAIDLEWLRDVPPDQTKEFLLSILGLGLKSTECVRLLTLHHLAFPVDTNVARIAVRLGWVPLQPLPESLQLHLLELYELHYQLITFGKVFCTKNKPNCNACPMRGECRHFASAFASARLALPGPEEKEEELTSRKKAAQQNPSTVINKLPLPFPEDTIQEEFQHTKVFMQLQNEPFVEMPTTPEPERYQPPQNDIEDAFKEESCEIPTTNLNIEEFTLNVQNYMQQNMELQEGEMSKALVALHPNVASISTPKLKDVSRLRTEHYVYELPDSHPLLNGWEQRETDDPGKYLLAIWAPGEKADSIQPPERKCSSQNYDQLCKEDECFACSSLCEANSQIVRGTILIPCRTAMRGSFPLNGTYFQVNEVFADNDSSINPISVPRSWIWNLDRRKVYFGTSVTSIFKVIPIGQKSEQNGSLNSRLIATLGYVCVRGFDRTSRAPRPLLARLHFPRSKKPKKKDNTKKKSKSTKKSKQNKEQPESLSKPKKAGKSSNQKM
ncbi:unnamed protein product [Sphenostylis stenocarpa]|uniref:HhH-GPD domain-containing protein n=1 Tax=Sphenostylis stenocarpa TaxID=92480 RepID=A0AA86VW56_9FABA|nr:unnamed protein product [Sphenostylis stenocarpa]